MNIKEILQEQFKDKIINFSKDIDKPIIELDGIKYEAITLGHKIELNGAKIKLVLRYFDTPAEILVYVCTILFDVGDSM